jgi:multisubunit Na+/H+ antiporter MnhB subunit
MGDMGSQSMMGYSNSFDNLLSGLFSLLIKFLIIALIVILLIGMFVWIKNNFFKSVNLTTYINQNPIIKSILGLTVAIFGLLILFYLYNYLFNPGMGYSYNFNIMNGNSSNVFNGTLAITGIITFLVKVLMYVFAITLIISLAAYFKKQFESGNFHFFETNNPVNKNYSNDTSTSESKVSMNLKEVDQEDANK